MSDTTSWRVGDIAELHSDELALNLAEGDPVTVIAVSSDPGTVSETVTVHIRTEDGRDFVTDPDEIRARRG